MRKEVAMVLLFAMFNFAGLSLLLFFIGFESLEAIKFGFFATIINFISIALIGTLVESLFK